jgi:hypothetical protein
MKTSKEKLIVCVDNAIKELDIEKIQTAMKALNWKWIDVGIPNKKQIVKTIRGLADTAISLWNLEKNPTESSVARSGGFEVMVWDSHDDGPTVQIKFVLEEGSWSWNWGVDGQKETKMWLVETIRYGKPEFGVSIFGVFDDFSLISQAMKEYNDFRGGKYPAYYITEIGKVNPDNDIVGSRILCNVSEEIEIQ